jgi:hypothetical protein
VEVVAVKLHNQDRNSQENGKHEGYHTLDTSIKHVQRLLSYYVQFTQKWRTVQRL